MKQYGFSLIELLVATAIASLIAVMLFASYAQISKWIPRIDSLTEVNEKAELLNAQLEKDFAGLTAPNEFYERQKTKKEPAAKEENTKKEAADKMAQEQQKKKAAQEESAKAESKKSPFQKIFYSTNQDGMLKELSFITGNPLQSYWGIKTGAAQPRMVRVWYVLKPDKNQQSGRQSYALWRSESSNIDYEQQNRKEYIIADGIRSLKVSYKAMGSSKKSKEEEKAAQPEKNKKELVESDTWLSPSPEASEDDTLPLIPQLIEWQIALWDVQKKRSLTFPLTFANRTLVEQTRADQIAVKLLESLYKYTSKMVQNLDNTTPVIQNQPQQLPRGT